MAGPLDNPTATHWHYLPLHLSAFSRNGVRFQPEQVSAMAGMRNQGHRRLPGRRPGRCRAKGQSMTGFQLQRLSQVMEPEPGNPLEAEA